VNADSIRKLFDDVRRGKLTPDEGVARLRHLPFEDLGFAKVDHHRALRAGMPEVIFGEGKTPVQVAQIFSRLAKHGGNVLATRANGKQFAAVKKKVRGVEYRELARDLDGAQLKYQEMRSKQSEVQVSQNLETEHKGERFTMIEPPLPPEKPISPNRVLILALGFVLSLGAGVGAAMLRENLDVSVRGVRDMRALLSVPPLAAIPVIVTRADSRRHRRAMTFSCVGSVAGLVALTSVVHFYVRPLDVVWISLLRRFGI